MISFYGQAIFSAIVIGVIFSLITTLLGRKWLPPVLGTILVFLLCLAYHAIAVFGMGPNFGLIRISVMIPMIIGFAEGIGALLIALGIQAILAGIVGMGLYWIMNKRK